VAKGETPIKKAVEQIRWVGKGIVAKKRLVQKEENAKKGKVIDCTLQIRQKEKGQSCPAGREKANIGKRKAEGGKFVSSVLVLQAEFRKPHRKRNMKVNGGGHQKNALFPGRRQNFVIRRV